ncbi:uncharacterized protein LOC126556123 [Anopheles maculipalpis]|uniref:uncharacterized protein LOC126556123 n=1 Tax=Anopheles maculipalpis TaxID=1496333 RepID=UPI002158B066|nr:uncharacterized protein LOC126556123 [Anopheles maculipalpis]
MWSLGSGKFTHVRTLLAVVVCLSIARKSFACNCVPVNLCPSPEVDLRLADIDGLVCPADKVCCDVPVDENPSLVLDELTGAPCDGVCVTSPLECAGEVDSEESGKDYIDVRIAAGVGCPANQYCCRSKTDEPATCNETCQPMSLCTLPVAGGGCGEENICCRMNRSPWFEMINDINRMADPEPGVDRESACEWRKVGEDGTRFPRWLVSVWARVEIIPGLQADQFVCSGVLVDPSLVLTTASSVKNVPTEKMFVNVGDYDISSRSALRTENMYTIKEQTIHEDYSTFGLLHHDVALLRLASPVHDGQCVATLASSLEKEEDSSCYTIGWNRTLLATRSGQPGRYPVQVTSFLDDPYCAPGAICLGRDEGRCNYDTLDGSPIVCMEGVLEVDWKLRGLLVNNCSGVPIKSVVSWLDYQRNPGFVQEVKPAIPDRRYLPVL